jgi:hypothetical protein
MVSSSNAPSDDDSALDESEQLNLPLDVALRQQRIQAWHPVLDPVWVIFALFYLGVIFVPTGTCRIPYSCHASFPLILRHRKSTGISLYIFHF